jgi:hypothetical protein
MQRNRIAWLALGLALVGHLESVGPGGDRSTFARDTLVHKP